MCFDIKLIINMSDDLAVFWHIVKRLEYLRLLRCCKFNYYD